jgi:class 3 adenylate cyclase/tRNA A-37 threonylcarbamoyl transferase component Bud32
MEELEPSSDADTIERGDYDPAAITRTDVEPLIGCTLGGRYLVRRKLGHGGFGVVYLASDEKMLSRSVVVKALLEGEVKNEWTVRKFKQEIEALARIDHPSIVGIFDVGELPDGKPFIVMQYVDGFSLRRIISPEGVDFWRAANIIRQIGRALTAAHDRGILHRDLKPENIMLQALGDGEEQVKIIDFGIARVKNSVIANSTVGDRTVGTIAYMSPEQLSAGQISPASDVYCFGVIAYELLTGRRPANPESAYQLLEMQRSGVRIKPVDLRPGLPQQAESIILKALSFDPKDRPQRARDFGDLLSSALLGDDEQTVIAGHPALAKPGERAEATVAVPETAHVLYMDVVGYSKMMVDEQPACLQKLQSIVGRTEDFNRAQATKQLIRLPTGDGISLVFFGDPEAPVRCALDIAYGLKSCPEVKLRMGIHSGLVYRMADINTNMNVAGGGINIAQRVMDCGDAGHILVSKRVADDLIQLARWAPCLHDLGEAEVKHGVRVPIFNLYTDEVGNPEIPAKLKSIAAGFAPRSIAKIAAVALGLLLVGAGAFFALKPRNRSVETPAAVAPTLPEQSLTYSLTVQKTDGKRSLGEPFESTGREIFGNGWKFRFNVQPMQDGALYLINEPAGQTGYNVLFPTPKNNNGSPKIAANKRVETSWLIFDKNEGIEKLWVVWSPQVVPDLDAIFSKAFEEGGEISGVEEVGRLQKYLDKYSSQRPEIKESPTKDMITVRGRSEALVSLVELNHKPY